MTTRTNLTVRAPHALVARLDGCRERLGVPRNSVILLALAAGLDQLDPRTKETTRG